MKDITTYINEVSKGLARRAYNKATGAQKNRLKKLYKEIYGSDITKSDTSHIKFSGDYKYFEDELKHWSQDVLDKIESFNVKYHPGDSESEYDININDGEFEHYICFELQEDEDYTWMEVTDTDLYNLKGENDYGIEAKICMELYKELNK